MKFILSRTDDYKCHSKKWVIGYAFLFWLITRVAATVAVCVCVFIYEKFGINPQNLTKFGGDPTAMTSSSQRMIATILVIGLTAPLFEELVFRFGLSLKRLSVATSLSCVVIIPVWSHYKIAEPISWVISIIVALIIFWGVYGLTSDSFFMRLKSRWQVPIIWLSSIAFGLVHLCAFSSLTPTLLPYALTTILIPFFAGCSCAYLRVNIGFMWGVAFHIFNNIPGLIILYLQSL